MCCQTAKYDADGKPEHTTVCLNSATAAMEMALRVLGIGEGDEVIVPAYTYTATASSVCHVGARPVLIDCAPGSFEMDYEKMADAINERTKAVMPVDLGGVVADSGLCAAMLANCKSGADELMDCTCVSKEQRLFWGSAGSAEFFS